MKRNAAQPAASLAERVEDRVFRSTHGRIRNLLVEETRGTVLVSGEVRTWYTKQLALQGALELLSGASLTERIRVVPQSSARH